MTLKEYGKELSNFMAGEISSLIRKDRCIDLFQDIDFNQDVFELLHKKLLNF